MTNAEVARDIIGRALAAGAEGQFETVRAIVRELEGILNTQDRAVVVAAGLFMPTGEGAPRG